MNGFNNKSLLLKKWGKNIEGSLEFYDSFNGFIIIIGFLPIVTRKIQILEVIDASSGTVCHKSSFCPGDCSSISINKYRTDGILEIAIGDCSSISINKYRTDGVLEIAIGKKNGEIEIMKGRWKTSNFNIFNVEKYDFGEKVTSICYISKDNLVFSKCGYLYVFDGKDRCKWSNNGKIKFRNAIYDIQKFKDDAVLGIVHGKILVFFRNKKPYEIFNDNNCKVINFWIDHSTSMLSISCAKKLGNGRSNKTPLAYILCEITRKSSSSSNDEEDQKYFASTVKNIPYDGRRFPINHRPTIFSMIKGVKSSMYTLLPDFESKKIGACCILDGDNILGDVDFEELKKCVGTICVNEAQKFLPNVFKRRIIVLFKYQFDVIDLYCSIPGDQKNQ
uniref:Uncharacterized protein n=1 Tax=Strongyloides papillosus TaxID=174720 RepID=A0A0N5BEY9_STREA